jgi:hypothetical protein
LETRLKFMGFPLAKSAKEIPLQGRSPCRVCYECETTDREEQAIQFWTPCPRESPYR